MRIYIRQLSDVIMDTNALATFQSCMNKVFGKKLHKFVRVFFDDILIYRKSWDEHIPHLDIVVTILEDQFFLCKVVQM